MNKTLVRTALTTDQTGRSVQLDYYLLSEYTAGLESTAQRWYCGGAGKMNGVPWGVLHRWPRP